MKKYILIGIGALTITLLTVYFMLENNPNEILSIDKTKQDTILSAIEKVEAQEDTVSKWVEADEIEGGLIAHPNEDVLAQYKKKQGVVEFLFATVLMENPTLFIQSFQPETISKDLFKVEEPDKMLVAKQMIHKISRNNTLIEVGYSPINSAFGAETDESEVTLRYEDGLEVNLVLTFSKGGTAHAEDDSIYSVDTSAWQIIDRIESH